MKQIKLFCTLFVFCLGASATAYSQLNHSTIDMSEMMRNTQNNIINGARNRILAGNSGGGAGAAARAATERREKAGAAKIKAGKATTRFVSTIAGTQALAKDMTWDEEQPTLDSQVRHIQKNVKMFEALMTKNGFTPGDYADGYAFAYALSYAAYNDRDMDKQELERLRREKREALLAAAFFQGVEDIGKQYQYELSANMAMQAAEHRIKARRAKSGTERQISDAKAKENANYMLGN